MCTGTKKHVIGGGRDGGGKRPRVETGEEEVWWARSWSPRETVGSIWNGMGCYGGVHLDVVKHGTLVVLIGAH